MSKGVLLNASTKQLRGVSATPWISFALTLRWAHRKRGTRANAPGVRRCAQARRWQTRKNNLSFWPRWEVSISDAQAHGPAAAVKSGVKSKATACTSKQVTYASTKFGNWHQSQQDSSCFCKNAKKVNAACCKAQREDAASKQNSIAVG